MKVVIRTQQASDPIVYPNALGTFQKCDMFCVFFVDKDGERVTHKYPMQNLFRVENSYPESDHGENPPKKDKS